MQTVWENRINRIFDEVARGTNLNRALSLIADQIAAETQAPTCKIWVVKRGDICDRCPLADVCTNRQMCMHLAAASGADMEQEYPRIPLALLNASMIARGGIADFSDPGDTGEKLFGLQCNPINGERDTFALYPLKGMSGTVGLIGIFNHRPLREEELLKLFEFAPVAVAAIRVAEMQSRCDSLRTRLEKETASVSGIQQAAREREAELEDAVAQLTHLVAQLQVERESISRTNEDLNRKTTEMEEVNRLARERAEMLEETQQRNGQAASEMASQIEARRRRTEEENMQLSGRIAMLEVSIADLNKVRESLMHQLDERNGELERLKTEFATQRAEFDKLRETSSNLEARQAILEADNSKLVEHSGLLESEHARLVQEKESVIETIIELQRSLRIAEDERTRHEQNRVSLEERIEQFADEVERKRAENKRAVSENERLAAEIERLRGEAEQLKSDSLNLSEDNARLLSLNMDLTTAQTLSETRTAELEIKSQALEKQIAEQRAESSGRIASLERETQELSQTCGYAASRISELEQTTISLDESRSQLQSRANEAENEAAGLRSEKQDLQAEIERLKQSSAELEQENAAAKEANAQLEAAIERFESLTARLEDSALKLRGRAEASDRARAELEQRNRVLVEQNRRLQIESHAQARFLTNMSHELRTPMNAIIGFTSLLLDDRSLEMKDRQRNNLERVSRNARDLLELINNVLDLSKIEAGRMDVYSEPTDLRDLIERVISVVEPLKENRPLKLSSEVEEGLPTLKTDRMKLQQILINLLSNAVKFTQEGEVRVLAERAAGGTRISVIDTGAGIAESDLPKIFEEFRQVGSSGRSSRSGTGLGLTITRRLVELLGGRISVTSRLGSGTTFTLMLPVEIEGRIADTPETEAPLTDPNRTALVIDSDPASLYLTKKYLTEAGYSVAATDDAGRGAEIAKLAAPAIITIDLDLLEDSAGIIQQIARDAQESGGRNRAIIVLSSDPALERSATEAGAKLFLRKPVEREQLVAALDRANSDAIGRVLVVDDDMDALDLVVAMIEESGYEIQTARNGRSALEEIGNTPPDAVILDLMLPEIDGFEIAHRLSLNPEWREIPIIMLTARDLTHEERRALARGAVRIIQKGNFTRDELLAELSLAMDRKTRSAS